MSVALTDQDRNRAAFDRIIDEVMRGERAYPPHGSEIEIAMARRMAERGLIAGYRDWIDAESGPAWFHKSQLKSWACQASIVVVCAGWQSGKTVSLPHWLKREIQRKGPGDYGAFSSTFKLLNRKFLPELKKVFANKRNKETDLAIYRVIDQQFVFTDEGNRRIHGSGWNGEPTIIQLGHAENPDSLESATMKAVVWDECGQHLVPRASFEVVRSRLMVNRGRMMLASKPYEANWFTDLVKKPTASVEVISYASWDNPENPREDDPYWDEIRESMPDWKYKMFYGGIVTQPAGLIYDCFDRIKNVCTPFQVLRMHPTATLHPGLDFGKIHTAGLAVADDPSTGTIYVIGEYLANKKRDYPEHIQSMRELLAPYAGGRDFSVGCGGNKEGEDGWREAYRMRGLALEEPPDNSVEVQIQAVWSLLKTRRLIIFESECPGLIDQIQEYSRKVDDEGNVLPEILNDAKYHYLAALRYICIFLRPNLAQQGAPKAGGKQAETEPQRVAVTDTGFVHRPVQQQPYPQVRNAGGQRIAGPQAGLMRR